MMTTIVTMTMGLIVTVVVGRLQLHHKGQRLHQSQRRRTITASGARADTAMRDKLGGNGGIEIGPAGVAGQRLTLETTGPAPAGGAPIPTIGEPTINRASRAHTPRSRIS